MKRAIILYDGVCNLCNKGVLFIIERDSCGYFSFASLQGEVGQGIQQEYQINPKLLRSLLLVENDRMYVRSAAVLRIARHLSWPWPLMAFFYLLPQGLRDFFYNVVANNRYDWFGQSKTCRLPTPNLEPRFLDDFARQDPLEQTP